MQGGVKQLKKRMQEGELLGQHFAMDLKTPRCSAGKVSHGLCMVWDHRQGDWSFLVRVFYILLISGISIYN